jgi:hypothetical protein
MGGHKLLVVEALWRHNIFVYTQSSLPVARLLVSGPHPLPVKCQRPFGKQQYDVKDAGEMKPHSSPKGSTWGGFSSKVPTISVLS